MSTISSLNRYLQPLISPPRELHKRALLNILPNDHLQTHWKNTSFGLKSPCFNRPRNPILSVNAKASFQITACDFALIQQKVDYFSA